MIYYLVFEGYRKDGQIPEMIKFVRKHGNYSVAEDEDEDEGYIGLRLRVLILTPYRPYDLLSNV
jgi:hypothetical protein